MRYDFSPLYRSTVGFDRLFSLFDEEIENAANWPPYNIEKIAENVRTFVEKSPFRPIGPMFSNCPGNDRPGYASRLTVALWPICKPGRSS